MLRIFNIEVKKDRICCNYEPEKSGRTGYIEMNADATEILKVDYSEYEFSKKTYVAQARNKIATVLNNSGHLPNELYAVWY